MTIKPGDTLPAGTLTQMTADGPKKVPTAEIFGGRKVVLFAVPGAFTPTCNARHLPGYIQDADAFKAKGVDLVACMAVNDPFVMHAWGKASAVDDKVLMLADGSADYTRALGLEMDASAFGMGIRSKRFALVAENGVVKALYVENPGEFKVSDSQYVLAQL